ncbi:MAG: DNA-3-methyladenine glycosylase [Actinomycetota bacterium]|nr:DNA-3-methyladenine glycosylase [Actinomycetota bacterium]
MPRISHARAAAALADRDPGIAGLLDAVGPPKLRSPQGTPFVALARAICFQQLSGKAAATIFGRFVDNVGGELTPEAVLATPIDDLRRAGLSNAKALSVLDLAAKVLDGTVPLHDAGKLTDDELVERLVVVRGIGRWTAEMFLIFQLRRLDVWPIDDLGVRKGYAKVYGLATAPTPKELLVLGDAFRPYRSVAAWYMWRATEIEALPGW